MQQVGTCSACGTSSKLTFEHVPPRSALNAHRTEVFSGEDWLNRHEGGLDRGRIQQRGSGYQATCQDCNNGTGSWYVRSYLDWVRRGADVLGRFAHPARLDQDPQLHHVTAEFTGVRPLPFLKQVAYMHLVVNGWEFTRRNIALRDFVLARESTGLPERYHFHLGLIYGPSARHVGIGAKYSLESDTSAVLSEIAFPPFSYVLRIGERLPSLPPLDISRFASYGLDEVVDMELGLLVGFTHTPFHCDYRSSAGMQTDIADSDAFLL